ncbi:MAG: hypothetical protein NC350_00230 [Corallococcus sp.]|nr:hypothetical protein [Corallococcus sp.]
MTKTSPQTELQLKVNEMRAQLEQLRRDVDVTSNFMGDFTLLRISDLRNLLQILAKERNVNVQATLLNAMHGILDEIKVDCELVFEQGFAELATRYEETFNKLLRGGE